MMKQILISILFLISVTNIQAQKVLDEVVAVVGNEVVLLSDVESQLTQYKDISSTIIANL